MVHIQKIVAKNFKSFAKTVEIPMDQGFNCIIGPNGSGKSARYDTEVLLSSGEIKPIGELVEDALKNSQIKVNLDDGVYTPENPNQICTWGLEPNTMKVVPKAISAFIKREGEPYLYTIVTKSGREVTTTGCHPVMVFKDGKIQSEIVDNLTPGSFISVPNKLEFPEIDTNISFEGVVDSVPQESLARFIGYLVGDGCIHHPMGRFELVNQDPKILEDFVDITEQLGFNPTIYKTSGPKAKRIYAHSKTFTESLSKFFKNNYKKEKKHIPSKIIFAKKEILANFLAALFDCDGYVRKDNPTFEYTTMSKKLSDDVLLCLLRFGIVARRKIKKKYATNTKEKKKKDYYFISIEGKEKLSKLYKQIPLRCLHKRCRLKKHANNNIVPNPNTDVLPIEVNSIVKEVTKILCIPVKALRKKHPTFAAYNESRCCATRPGLKRVLGIFNKKVSLFNKHLKNLPLSQEELMQVMRELRLSRVKAAKSIGVTRSSITDSWDKNKFNARPKNLKKLHAFIETEMTQRLDQSGKLIETLYRLSDSDIFWDPIVDIKKIKGDPYVYDLTIPNCHNFIGNGIFVHNSNVADSLCFVLGKSSAKSMRAEKTANLIYNGGKNSKPARQAEVSVYIDNKDKQFPVSDATLQITRIVKGSGQSSYLINGKKHTRQQMVDLLKGGGVDPDGHNIILQGDIVRFMELKADERRELIEEIAGISMYEEKKLKSVSELDKVQEKLNEANIILAERKTHLDQLKKDRDLAKRYKQLEQDLKRDQATLIHMGLQKKEQQRQEAQSKLKRSQEELDDLNQKISETQNEVASNQETIQQISNEIESSGKVKQGELVVNIQQLKDGLVKKGSRLEVCNTELSRIHARKKQLHQTKKELTVQIDQLQEKSSQAQKLQEDIQKEVSLIDQDITTFKEKHKSSLQSSDLDEELETLQTTYLDKHKHHQNTQTKLEQINFRLDSLKTSLDPKGLEKFSAVQKDLEETSTILSNLIDEDSTLHTTITDLRSQSTKLNEELARLRVRDVTIREFAGVHKAVQRVKTLPGVFGTVADLGVVESKYGMALQVAAGSRMNSVVVKDDKVATSCIERLKKERLGVVTFLPLTKIKPRMNSPGIDTILKQKDVVGLGIDLVQFDQKFRNVFSYVFGSTLVVQTLNTAKKIGIGRHRMVTLEGDLIEPSGAMIGGFRKLNPGTAFKEKDVSERLGQVRQKLKTLSDQIPVLEQRKSKKESEILLLREKKASIESQHIILKSKHQHQENSRKEFDSLTSDKVQFKTELDTLTTNLDMLSQQLATLKQKRQEHRSTTPQTLQRLEELESKRSNKATALHTVVADLKSFEAQITSVLLPEKNNTKKILLQLDKELGTFEEEVLTLTISLKEDKESLKESQTLQRTVSKQFESQFKQRDKCTQQIQKLELQVIRFEERSRAVEERINGLTLERARIVSELEGQKKALEEYQGIIIRKGKSVDELKQSVNQAQKELNNLGNVNLRALEIYEKIQNEYQVLVDKTDNLNLEKEDVLGLIQEIDGKKEFAFLKTFKGISTNFKTIFSQLTTKANASLELEDTENPLDGGIAINVKLAGSKTLDVRSLSGGEKTMAALAFIFSIQEHRPATFYLLDEVDAALDKANSELLSKLIGQYSSKAQYIVISHNDYVINEANTIYGVSMQDGISKVVSLKV